jgi:hypothetical protein
VEDNIKIDVREIEWGIMDWIRLTQDIDQWMAFASAVFAFRKSSDTLECLSKFSRTISMEVRVTVRCEVLMEASMTGGVLRVCSILFCLLHFILYSEEGASTSFRISGKILPNYLASYLKIRYSSRLNHSRVFLDGDNFHFLLLR